MDKQHILDEIVRTAKANNGVPLGFRSFYSETGIKTSDWQGKHWARWGEAIREAGLAPNQMTQAYDDNDLLAKLSSFIGEIGRYPTQWDIRMKCRKDENFPNESTFRRLGTKQQIAARVMTYCKTVGGFDTVALVCESILSATSPSKATEKEEALVLGYVYLIKSGRHYKVGKSNAVGRREREIALQLPDKAVTVHSIKTDDPSGIEGYWHRRFADRRKNGEWFALEIADVSAFKRRKFM